MDKTGADAPAIFWAQTYNRRRLGVYAAENLHLEYSPLSKQALISAFFDDKRQSLESDPPTTFWYSALRDFLHLGDWQVFDTSSPSASHNLTEVILLDDRKDLG